MSALLVFFNASEHTIDRLFAKGDLSVAVLSYQCFFPALPAPVAS
jgi:hypothetical protein